jgi:hypothetical protein
MSRNHNKHVIGCSAPPVSFQVPDIWMRYEGIYAHSNNYRTVLVVLMETVDNVDYQIMLRDFLCR